MTNFKKYILILSVILLVSFMALPVWADHLFVGPGSGEFPNLQMAIEFAYDGDIIHILPGTYVESGQIVISKDLKIIGEGRPVIKPNQDTASADKTNDNSGWWLVTASGNLDLENVVLDGAGHNIFSAIRGVGTGRVDNCEFRNIKFTKYIGFGMWTLNNWTITNNTFFNMEREGIMAKFMGVTNAVITGNTYHGKGTGDWLDYGVELGAGAVGTIANNTITDCRGVASDGSTSAAIQITTYFGPGTTGTVIGNILTNNTDGIAVGYDGSDTSSVEAHYNYLAGNDSFGINNTSATNSVNAKSNTWGSIESAVISTMVTGLVDTSNPSLLGAKGDKGDPGTNGADGKDGKDGTNGTNGTNGVSVTATPEPAGLNCAAGGVKYTSASGDSYVCNGQGSGMSSWTDGMGNVSTTQKVGIGTASPWSTLHVAEQDGTKADRGLISSQHYNGPTAAIAQFERSRGTLESPITLTNGDSIGAFHFRGYDGSAYQTVSSIVSKVTGSVSAGSVPGQLFFYTGTDTTSNFSAPKMVITTSGNVGIGTTAPSQSLEVNGGVRLNTATVQPVCDANARGTFWFTNGGTGKDSVQVCAQDGSGTLAWQTIY